MTTRSRYLVAASLSGLAWFCLALVLESATEGWRGWAIPRDSAPAFFVFAFCGGLTGLAVSYTFRSSFRRARGLRGACLPLVTLPFGISLFGVLVFVARWGMGYRFSPDPGAIGTFTLILVTYLAYSFMSVALVVVYPLSLVNQRIMRSVLVSAERTEP
jgi:hypothetical protein